MTAPDSQTDVIPTGIDALDSHLGGGLPSGTTIGLCAPAASAGEFVAYSIATAPNRATTYLTTARSADAVETDLGRYRAHARTPPVAGGTHDQDRDGVHPLTVSRIPLPLGDEAGPQETKPERTVTGCIEAALEPIEPSIPGRAGTTDQTSQRPPVLVVDAFSSVVDRTTADVWRPLLNKITTTVTERDGLACLVVHSNPDGPTSPLRHVLHTMDAVATYDAGGVDEPDRLRLTKLRPKAPATPSLPVTLPLLVEDVIKRNPDERA